MPINLFNQPDGLSVDPDTTQVPAYLLAGNNHNIGNQSSSWFDPTTWGDRAGNSLKFGAVSIISGASQLYNSGVTVGNWFGADAQEVKIDDVVSSLDSDLGKYYTENTKSADLVGFIASSLIPGIGGVKLLNAGQAALRVGMETGMIGGNLARATGLLVPRTETFIKAAAHDINVASATFSAISQNGIKALASGVYQQTLEAVAFETMVQATMFRSPVLSEQDTGDVIKNIAIGGLLGGVIGGAVVGAGTYGKIMKGVRDFEKETKFSTARATQQELNRPDINIIREAEDLENAARVMPPPPGASPEEVTLYNTLQQNIVQREVRTQNSIRENFNALAKGNDLTTTNMLADASRGLGSRDLMNGVLHAEEIVRPGVLTKVEQEMAAGVKETGKIPDGLQVSYVKLTGEGAGKVIDGEPSLLSLADKVAIPKGGSIADGVLAAVKKYKFNPEVAWDAAAKTGVTFHTEAEARYIWASRLEKLADDLPIHKNDIPLLETAFRLGKLDVKLIDDTGAVLQKGFSSRDELWKYLVEIKESIANDLLLKRVIKGKEDFDTTAPEIAKIVNTKVARLDGTAVKTDLDDYQAWQTTNREYSQFLTDRKIPVKDEIDTRFRPTFAKIARRLPEDFQGPNGHLTDGMAWIKTQEKLAKETMDNVFATAAGDLANYTPDIPESLLWQANRGGAGAGETSFANAGYGTLAGVMQSIGGITRQLKTFFRSDTQSVLEGVLANLGRNEAASIEFSTINQKVTRSGKLWVRYTDGDVEEAANYLITKEGKAKLADEKNPITVEELADTEFIRINSKETVDVIDMMIQRSRDRTDTYKSLRSAQGKTDQKDSEVFRPVRPNPKDYPFFAFVKDDKVTGQGHTTMIFASDAKKLAQLGDKAEQAGYRVHYKSDSKDFHEAYGDYEYQRTLHESYIDSDLKNRGIYSEHYTKTNPQKIVNDVLQQHLREDDVLAMELLRGKYQKEFNFLEDQGKAYSRIESSSFTGTVSQIEKAGKNPYIDYIKTALDISKGTEGLTYSFNKLLDTAVSRAVGSIRDSFSQARSPADLKRINGLIDKHGLNTGYRDAALDLLVNHTAPKGELTKFVRNANAILANLTLGLDPLNSLVNAIGANVLRGTELTQITRLIKEGNTELAGELGRLAKITLPTGDQILSPGKLIKQSIANYFADGSAGPLAKRYTEAGYMTGDATKFHAIIDDFSLKGTETVSDLTSRVNRAFVLARNLSEKGQKITGNKLAEDFNRFISADVMRQLTDLAQKYKILTPEESHSYINTFVNRVEGNTVASQRPLIFQGPLGNAIGLFQSYQFNMIQQLFRYSAEGKAKDVAMLLGLQGTFFGLNGLPGFQFVNQHVIGTASGNKNHVDAYDAVYGAMGKQMGDLFMYGLPSDILRSNLYSRGDINPRQLTIIPTSPTEIPFIGAFGKFLGSMKETVGKIAGGGDVWSSFLQGVEHNGISRPLAGLAQTLQATGPGGKPYSTTSKGNILFSNDLVSLATLTRLAGGRPLDEAVVNDGVFRIHSYQQYDRSKMQSLAETVKTASIEGRRPDEDQMIKFAAKYAESGGKQQNFNKWVLNQMKNANTNEAQKITAQLQNPFAQKVQLLMGGADTEF